MRMMTCLSLLVRPCLLLMPQVRLCRITHCLARFLMRHNLLVVTIHYRRPQVRPMQTVPMRLLICVCVLVQ
eukprot:6331775-Amphidinium_carterae.1